jgi:hypothetical protein
MNPVIQKSLNPDSEVHKKKVEQFVRPFLIIKTK